MNLLQRLLNPLSALLAQPSPSIPLPHAGEGSARAQGEGGLAALRGPDGRDIPTPKRPQGVAITTVRVEDLWSTYPSTGLTPAKLAAILREADAGSIERAMELADEVEAKSARILTGLQTRKRAVQKLDWTITPASAAARDQEIADFVRKNLTDCGLRKPVYHLLDALYKGFAALWINWRMDNGQVWLGSLDWTPQTRWTYLPRDFAPDAPAPLTPRLLTHEQPIYGEEIQPFTFVLHTDTTRSTLPQRAGLWRTLVWYWMFGTFALKDWLVFLDRYGQPFKLGKYPAGMDPAEVDVLKAAVRAAGDSGAVINDQTMLELLETKGTGTDMHERLTRYCDEQITLAILGQLASTQGTPGQLGNAEEQSDVREDLIQADAADLAETLTNQLLWPLVGWNYGWDVLLPHFAFTFDKAEDLEKKSLTYKTLVEIGVPVTVRQAQEAFGIRPAEGDEAILQMPPPGTSFAALTLAPSPVLHGRGKPEGQGEGARLAAAAREDDDPTPATLQTDRMDQDTTRHWVKIMDHIKQLVDEAESLPALRDALLAAYADLEHDKLAEIMAMGFAAADLAGRYDTGVDSE